MIDLSPDPNSPPVARRRTWIKPVAIVAVLVLAALAGWYVLSRTDAAPGDAKPSTTKDGKSRAAGASADTRQ